MSQQPPEKFKIVIEGRVEGDDVHLTMRCHPMLATHSIAHLLESAVAEIRAGRLDSLEIRS